MPVVVTLMPYADPVRRQQYLNDYKRRNRHRSRARQKITDAVRHANERAAAYGCDGRLTFDEAALLLSAAACHYCDSPPPLTLDHVVPLNAGGRNRPANIVASCLPCNISKFRQDRPGRWSREHDACVSCGTGDRKHVCHGLCTRCYSRSRHKRERARRAGIAR